MVFSKKALQEGQMLENSTHFSIYFEINFIIGTGNLVFAEVPHSKYPIHLPHKLDKKGIPSQRQADLWKCYYVNHLSPSL